jgi:NAD(P)-dependent dehydrogenase (short-subunit alcohol dehydrogenase family)
MDLKLNGRRALVTGSSIGLGRAIAILLAEGATVVAHGREGSNAMAADIRSAGGCADIILGDCQSMPAPTRSAQGGCFGCRRSRRCARRLYQWGRAAYRRCHDTVGPLMLAGPPSNSVEPLKQRFPAAGISAWHRAQPSQIVGPRRTRCKRELRVAPVPPQAAHLTGLARDR